MEQQNNIINNIISTCSSNDATINECMVANLLCLGILDEDTYLNKELDFIKEKPRKENCQLKKGEVIRIIAAFKNLLNKRKEYYLNNHWGINVKTIVDDINRFEQKFINLIKENVELVNELYTPIKNESLSSIVETSDIDFGINHSCPYREILYGFSLGYPALDKNLSIVKLFNTFTQQHEDLMYKIHDAATKNSEEYIAELRLSANLDIYSKISLFHFIEIVKLTTHEELCDNHIKKATKILKEEYATFLEKKIINSTEIEDKDNCYIHPLCDVNDDDIALLQVLCKNKNYIYFRFHYMLHDKHVIENHKNHKIGKILYNGYINWCKKNQIQPLITIDKSELIEYPVNIISTNGIQYHFPKKRFINNSLNSKREELNKAFLKKLLIGMIDEKIIAPDTKEEHFFFIFGYGENNVKDFKAIKILKSDTKYKRENGKRSILFLLKELMGYSDDEIRPTIGKNRHLIINSCFKASSPFKSSDFGEKTVFKASETMKANELLKMKKIYDTALNDTKETVQQLSNT